MFVQGNLFSRPFQFTLDTITSTIIVINPLQHGTTWPTITSGITIKALQHIQLDKFEVEQTDNNADRKQMVPHGLMLLLLFYINYANRTSYVLVKTPNNFFFFANIHINVLVLCRFCHLIYFFMNNLFRS